MVQYESQGLFVGLISYPFNVDGAELYNKVLRELFKQHKTDYLRNLSDSTDDSLYQPAAYRMFGSNGLAVLSLMDEFAFGARIFNPSHVDLATETADHFQYKCVALTGSSEQFLKNRSYLLPRAKKTFLRKNKRYPFIGIIRIKVECRLLFGHGIDVTRAIKKRTEVLKKDLIIKTKGRRDESRAQLESIIVDSYDSDELLMVAFANSFRILDSYFRDIRRMEARELKGIRWGKDGDLKTKHVCTACHMSYGYDYEFSFSKFPKKNFMEWAVEDDQDTENPHERLYRVQCIVEPNPGHQAALCKDLEKGPLFPSLVPPCEKTVTGGSVVKFRIALEDIDALHKAAREPAGIQGHIRRIKLVLEARRDFGGEHPAEKELDLLNEQQQPLIKEENKQRIKKQLRLLSISKITRERALALIDILNDCGRNPLQRLYFKLLTPAVENLETILKDFNDPDPEMPLEDIQHIEGRINSEINALETAIYNRMYNKMTPNAVLEYGGGIQQFLQAFGHAFRELVRVFSPDIADRQYLIISDAVKEFSTRSHTELNINHFIYPQLFCLTTWKEASNYTLQVLDKFEQSIATPSVMTKRKAEAFDVFQKLLRSDKALFELKNLVLNSISLQRNDHIYQTFEKLIDRSFLRYTLHDYVVYHFAFQRNFELMWRVNWKTFLQTSSCYSQRGVIHRVDFIYLMLRLMMVAYREKEETRKKRIWLFLDKARTFCPDPLLIPLWAECFDKLKQITEKTYKALTLYSFQETGDTLINWSENVLVDNEKILDEKRMKVFSSHLAISIIDAFSNQNSENIDLTEVSLASREASIETIKNGIVNQSLSFMDFDEVNPATPNNVICLMSAFLRAIDELDAKPSSVLVNATPRDANGEIHFDAIKSLKGHISGVTADPIGGFMIPESENRRKFFVYRTIFYRTLWDLSYRSLP